MKIRTSLDSYTATMWIIKKLKSLWNYPQTEDTQTWVWIKLGRNPSKLGKRYIAKMYKDWKLMATYPANKISDLDLSFFEKPWTTT